MQQQPGADDVARLGRIVRNAFLAAGAFIDALLNQAAWTRFGNRVFKRVVVVLVVGIAFAGITWQYSPEIFRWLLVPAGDLLTPFDGGLPVFTGPADMFGVTVSLSMRGGMLAASPVAIIGVYTLVSQWMPRRWRLFTQLFIPTTFIAFAVGIAFVYYVLLPRSLGFLLGFGEGVALPLISVVSYYELVMSLMFWMGIVFELPLAVYLLARLNLVTYRKLKWARLAVWFFAPFFAAIITPSFDAYTWAMVMVPLVLLYEVGLVLAWTARPEDGNYMFLNSIAHAVKWLYRKTRMVALAPVTVPRWAWRKVRRR